MAQITFTVVSLNDLKSIYEYIAVDSELYAEQMVSRIYKRIKVLEGHINIGKVVPEFNNISIREIAEGAYRIIYKVKNDDEVSIARIYHSARLLKKI